MAMQTDRPPTRPDPDPTVLTTAALLREIGNLRESFQSTINGLEKGLLARIEAIEKAVEVAHGDAVRIPTLLQEAIRNLHDLAWGKFEVMEEKFRTVQGQFALIATQFDERDTRVDQTAKASKEALDAALQAAKEAVGEQNKSNSVSIAKSEAATNKQIDQLNAQITQSTKASDDKFTDLKERIARIESRGDGVGAMWGWVATGAVALVSVVYYLMHLTR
jgi:hypothetical protein